MGDEGLRRTQDDGETDMTQQELEPKSQQQHPERSRTTLEVRMVEQGAVELKSQKLSNGHSFESETSDLPVLGDQMQQVQGEMAELLHVLAEQENNTDEISQCVFAQLKRDHRRLLQKLAKEQMHLVQSWRYFGGIGGSCSRGKGLSGGCQDGEAIFDAADNGRAPDAVIDSRSSDRGTDLNKRNG